jgi:cyanophycinase
MGHHMTRKNAKKPMLILSGGNEDADSKPMLRIAEETLARGGKSAKLIICPTSSGEPDETVQRHKAIFNELGIRNIEVLNPRTREQAMDPALVELLEGASAVFFTGGDQLRLTATVGDTPVFQRIRELREQGALIAGTSSGSAAIPETMLIGGESKIAPESDEISMAPGLALVPSIVIDTHFAERGRIGRLLAAVAQNAKNLGLGLDERTAIVVQGDELEVVGDGAVFIVDGSTIRFSSLSGTSRHGVTSIFGVSLHVLSDGDRFDLANRLPDTETAERELPERQVAK